MDASMKSGLSFVHRHHTIKRRGILGWLRSARIAWSQAIAAFGLSLCLQSAVAAPEPIRIGLLTVDSGSFAFMQAYFLDAAKLAVDNFNADGGILGRKVEWSIRMREPLLLRLQPPLAWSSRTKSRS